MKRTPFFPNGLRCMLTLAGIISMQPLFAQEPAPNKPDATTQAYALVKQMPTYQGGGIERFFGWMHEELQYPQEVIAERGGGTVKVKFVVETDGSLSGIEPLESSHPDFTREVLRVIHSAPKWTPAIQNGKFVRFKYVLPVRFNLN